MTSLGVVMWVLVLRFSNGETLAGTAHLYPTEIACMPSAEYWNRYHEVTTKTFAYCKPIRVPG